MLAAPLFLLFTAQSWFTPALLQKPEMQKALASIDERQTPIIDEWIRLTEIPAPSTKEAGASNLTTLRESRSIRILEFEWHDAKAEVNLAAHGVSFELAKTVFRDPFAVERLDERENYGEARFVIIGMARGEVLLFVAYTEREDRIRVISARRATTHEQDDYCRQNS